MTDTNPTAEHEVVVVGAGFVGICAAIKLKEAGIEDFVILERADDIGGTWRDNRYPGVAVDIPSVSYQFSFAQSGRWKRVFARGAEVKAYVDEVFEDFGLRPHLRLQKHVVRTLFDEDHHWWWVETADGVTTSARFLISAHGVFGEAAKPAIEGIDDFEGTVIHTLAWDDEHDVAGERVAVIGTGASSVQLVPELAREAGQVDVYQRTPIWLVPKPDLMVHPVARQVLRRVPPVRWAFRTAVSSGLEAAMYLGVTRHRQLPVLTRGIQRLSEAHLRSQVSDPEVRDRLRPTYDFGCKRPSMSNDYWRSFNRDNVDLVTDPIVRVHPHAIETADGTKREIDTLVLATGFKFFEPDTVPPYTVEGEGEQVIADYWREHGFQAYEGVSVPGYPNFFLVPGPYFATSWSWLVMAESRTTHIVRAITRARSHGATYSAVRPEAHDRYVAEVRGALPNLLFLSGDCSGSNTYYIGDDGEVSIVRPQSSVTAWWRARTYSHDDYELRGTA